MVQDRGAMGRAPHRVTWKAVQGRDWHRKTCQVTSTAAVLVGRGRGKKFQARPEGRRSRIWVRGARERVMKALFEQLQHCLRSGLWEGRPGARIGGGRQWLDLLISG